MGLERVGDQVLHEVWQLRFICDDDRHPFNDAPALPSLIAIDKPLSVFSITLLMLNSITIYGTSTSDLQRALFNNLVRSSLDLYQDEYQVEMIRLNSRIPGFKTKTEILYGIMASPLV
jgi:competence protein ComGF